MENMHISFPPFFQAAIGLEGANIGCNATSLTPRTGPPAVSVVVEIIVRNATGGEVPISGLEQGQFIQFFLPFAPEVQLASMFVVTSCSVFKSLFQCVICMKDRI